MDSNDYICPDLTKLVQSNFSKKCDILLYTLNLPESEMQEHEYLKNLGYFTPGFYMLDPFRYIGAEKKALETSAKDGVVFLFVNDDDLNDFYLTSSRSSRRIEPEALESIRFVIFRKISGDITVNDNGGDSSNVKCPIDTFEFLGVFKAEKNPDGRTYKMTKIFDRFYFDESKMLETNKG